MVSCFKVLFLLVSLLVLVAAVLLQNMEAVVTKLVKLERRSPGLDKLRVGWTMAGGDDGGSEGMSLAIKSILWASVFGPPQTASRSSWQRLSRVLADADREWVSAHRGIGLGPDGPQEIAEGHRAISHILRLALEIFVEVHPSRPKFTRLVSPTMKLQGDNPDAIYMIAAVTQPSATAAAAAASPASSASSSSSSTQVSGYVVRGKKHAKEVYFSIALMGYLGDAGLANVVGDLNDSAMDFGKDGSFEVWITPAENEAEAKTIMTAAAAAAPGGPQPVWMPLPPTASQVITRHYYENEAPAASDAAVAGLEHRISISTVAAELRQQQQPQQQQQEARGALGGTAPGPPSDEEAARRMDEAVAFVHRHTVGMPPPDPTTAPPFFSLVPNVIGKPAKWSKDSEGAGGVDIAYAAGPWSLRPDEALVMTVLVPPCRFANVVLWNRFLQTLDYTGPERVSLNRAQLVADDTSSIGGDSKAELTQYTLVLAHSNPGVPNWLSTEGRARGTIFWRYVLPEADAPAPTTKVVKFNELASTVGS